MEWDQSVHRARNFIGRESLPGRCLLLAVLTAVAFSMDKLLPLVATFEDSTVWWPSNGVTLALLLIARRRHWIYILLGMSFGTALSQVLRGNNLLEPANVALCNAIEVLIPALMLPRFKTLTEWLQEPKLVWNFVRFAVLLGPVLSALVSGVYFHFVLHAPYLPFVFGWGLADMVGIIMFTPLVLVLISADTYSLFRPRELSHTVYTILPLLAVSWIVFHQNSYPVAFLICPLVLLVATGTGFSGSVLAINLLAPIASAATLHGSGPFASISGDHEPYRVLVLQVFLILAMMMAFPISVARVQQQSISSQLQIAYLQMEALATADALTGLANRRRFDAALEAEWRRAMRDHQPIAVLTLDADNFKAYNDYYGHPAGDLCLQSIAAAICDIPRRGGDLVARYGGEEFVVLLPGVDAEGSQEVAELVRSNVRMLNLPHQGNESGRVTVSIGCASLTPREKTESSVLMKASDRALYTAKQSGRDQVRVFTGSELHDVAVEQSILAVSANS